MTGLYINEQPQIQFKVQFSDINGVLLSKSFKGIVALTDLQRLIKGQVEILYLPRDTDIFVIKFIDGK